METVAESGDSVDAWREGGVPRARWALFGTTLNAEGGRSAWRGDERRAGTIGTVSRSLGRGSWPRRAWLAPSVSPRRPR